MLHLDRDNELPLADQMVAQLAGLIQDGQMPYGTRLPSIRKLAADLRVSSATVVAAYDRLVARGLIESRAASGFFVSSQRQRPHPLAAPAPDQERLDAVWLMRRVLQRQEGMLQAGGGFLPDEWLEDMLSTRLLAAMARKGKRAFVTPGSAEGYAPLRSHLSVKLGLSGIPAAAEQILLTFGATQGIDLIGRTLLVPGDTVAVEEPGYFALFAQLRAHGAKLVPVPRLADGPDLAALAHVCATHHPKLFFTQTLLHNPTGSSTDPATAFRLLQLAEQHNLLVVEDDIYGDLYPGSNPVHLAQVDRLQRVIYLGSFSKVLSPNIRVGFIAAAHHFIERFLEQKLLSVLSTSEFDERLVYEILTAGNYRKHVERVKAKLPRQRIAVSRGLIAAGLRPMPNSESGLFVWAELPAGVDAETLVRDAAEHGFLLAPGAVFFLRPDPCPWLRFNVATANDARLFSYLRERIAALQTQAGQARRSVGPVA